MNLSVKETAALLNKSQQFVRIGLQQGVLPIGIAIKMNGERWTYHISKKRLEEYIGEIKKDRE